jgi:hypothetical protein
MKKTILCIIRALICDYVVVVFLKWRLRRKRNYDEFIHSFGGPGWAVVFPLIDVDHQKGLPSITFIKMAKKRRQCKREKTS